MKGNFKATEALALLTTTRIEGSDAAISRLKTAVLQELQEIPRREQVNAISAVLIGLGLHAIKTSLKHGEFTPWLEQNIPSGKIWTKTTAKKNASFYMRLAIAFVEEAKPSRPELLALASGKLSADLHKTEGPSAKLVKRIESFVGERSLNQLLVDEGIKDSAASTSTAAKQAALPADNDTLAEDAGQLLINFDAVLLVPDNLKRFSAKQLDDMEQQLSSRLDKFRELKAALLSGNTR